MSKRQRMALSILVMVAFVVGTTIVESMMGRVGDSVFQDGFYVGAVGMVILVTVLRWIDEG